MAQNTTTHNGKLFTTGWLATKAHWIPVLLGILLYLNTLPNKYALDDIPVIEQNKYVQEGIAGIGDIFSTDMFAGMYEDYNADAQLSGGRYRPLSIASFAIEYQAFGANPMYSHLINALLYGLLLALLFVLLKKQFLLNDNIAFVTILLFAVHPIHTEVVANIKSRDEILSMIGIIASLICAFKYITTPTIKWLALTALSVLLACLSKEYAVVLAVLTPCSILVFRKDADKQRIIYCTAAIAAAIALYALIRYNAVGFSTTAQNDILNNPYLLADASQQWATKIYVLLKYLALLVFPHPLSADYSYNTIPYKTWGDAMVILSLIIHIALVALAVISFLRKSPYSFILLWYILFLLPVSNLVMDIGATMGERLLFHASLAFCMALAVLYDKVATRLPRNVWYGVLTVIVVVAGFKTIARNKAWKDDSTLFTTDIKTVPNSIMVNNNVAKALIKETDSAKDADAKNKLLAQALAHTQKALAMHPRFTNAMINQGIIYHLTDRQDSAMKYWLLAKTILPNDPHFPQLSDYFTDRGLTIGKNNLPVAIGNFNMAVKLYEQNANAWSNLGGAYYTVKNYDSAAYCWQKTLAINPNDQNALNGYRAITSNKQ